MKQNEFLSLLASKGYRLQGTAAFGVWEKYPVTIVLSGNRYTASLTVAQSLSTDEKRALKDSARDAGLKVTGTGHMVSFQGKINIQDPLLMLENNMARLGNLLRDTLLTPPEACCLCGAPGANAYIAHVNGSVLMYDTVHTACVDQHQSQLIQKAEENPGSCLTGLVGALLGALVGAIPAIVALILGYLSALLFALIPICAHWGYKRFHGKMNIAAPIISIAASLAGMALLIFVWDVWANMSSFELSLGDALQVTSYYTFIELDWEYWSWITEHIGQVILFYVLGLVISFGTVARTNRTDLKNVEQLRQTMMTMEQASGAGVISRQPVGEQGQQPPDQTEL